jgi:hypothetical protein
LNVMISQILGKENVRFARHITTRETNVLVNRFLTDMC